MVSIFYCCIKFIANLSETKNITKKLTKPVPALQRQVSEKNHQTTILPAGKNEIKWPKSQRDCSTRDWSLLLIKHHLSCFNILSIEQKGQTGKQNPQTYRYYRSKYEAVWQKWVMVHTNSALFPTYRVKSTC